jgi:hypothetical protein
MPQIENIPSTESDCRSESDELLVTNLCLSIRLNKMWQNIFFIIIMIIINFLEIPGYVFRLYILGSVNCILVYRKWNNVVVSRVTALKNISLEE